MSSDALFTIKVISLFGLVFAAALWLLDGAPVPMRTVVPLKPDPSIPTFAEAVKQAQRIDRTSPQFKLDDAAQHLATVGLLYGFGPCNIGTRKLVVTHAENYYRLRRNHPNLSFTAREVSLPSGSFLLDDRKIDDIVGKLFRRGLLTLDEFSSQTRATLKAFVRPKGTTREEHYRKCLR